MPHSRCLLAYKIPSTKLPSPSYLLVRMQQFFTKYDFSAMTNNHRRKVEFPTTGSTRYWKHSCCVPQSPFLTMMGAMALDRRRGHGTYHEGLPRQRATSCRHAPYDEEHPRPCLRKSLGQPQGRCGKHSDTTGCNTLHAEQAWQYWVCSSRQRHQYTSSIPGIAG
jgi:hypothetical protein